MSNFINQKNKEDPLFQIPRIKEGFVVMNSYTFFGTGLIPRSYLRIGMA